MSANHDIAGRDPSDSSVAKVIGWSVANPLIVIVVALALAVAGWLATEATPLDAVPDLTDTQVIIRTDFPGQSPQVVEDLVTYPLSSALLGLPGTEDVRASSMFGTSFVTVVFEDGVDLYWARSRVLESLSRLGASLPQGAVPEIGPDATGVGWVYQYGLVDRSGRTDLAELRALQDFFVKLELSSVAGVAEVASVGGFEREYQVLVDPNRLRALGLSMTEVAETIRTSSIEVGGRVIERGETEYVLRTDGYVRGVDDLASTVIFARQGAPVRLRDVARVVEGPALRRGVVELNGEGETVAGIVVMRDGENALDVIDRVKARLADVARGLPDGVEIVTVYDRAPLIEGSVDYLRKTLIKEGAIVALVVLLFLLHIRASLIAVITLPLGVVGAFLIMNIQGVTANIMSLGGIAIAIGAMVDASIVLVENAARKLSDAGHKVVGEERKRIILESAREVGPGIFFSLLIITVSFLPVFALTGESYRLFSPLAFTKTYAMAFAALLSVTLVPVLVVLLLRGRFIAERRHPLMRVLIWLYTPLLRGALSLRWGVVALAVLATASLIIPARNLGSEFMPALYEGELLYMPTTLPGVSETKMRELLGQTNRLIATVPEVERVFGKAGRADTATDPAPLSMIETWIQLKPKSEWRPGLNAQDIIAELDQRLAIPGLVNSWGYPIKIRMDMVSTGVRTPIGVKITGEDLDELERLAREAEGLITDIPGTRSAFADRVLGGKYLEIIPNREALARRGISMAAFQSVVRTAIGGEVLSQSVQGRERYDILLRYAPEYRDSPEAIGEAIVPAPGGAVVTLSEVSKIRFAEGPPMIRSENARLTGWVFVDIEDRDLGSYVGELRRTLADGLALPPGYAVGISGQYEQLEEAEARLRIAIPAAILSVFLLLMLHFGRLDRTLLVMLSMPFGLVGGLWAVWLAGYNLSVAVAIGFIALGGIAVETAVIMLLYIDAEVRARQPRDRGELRDAVVGGAVQRLRPKLMTVLTIFAGLAPVFFTDGLGADVMRRIALPMVGGMASTLVLVLFVVPALYLIYIGRKFTHQPQPQGDSHEVT